MNCGGIISVVVVCCVLLSSTALIHAQSEDSGDSPSIYLEPYSHSDGRDLQKGNMCKNKNEALWRCDITTDNYPWEMKWRLFNSNGKRLAFGPPEGRNYERNTDYVGIMCLPVGKYYFRVLDQMGVGICCNYGDGSFTNKINGKPVVQSDDSNYEKKTYSFTVTRQDTSLAPPPTPRPTRRTSLRPTPKPVQAEAVVSFIMMGDIPYYTKDRYCLNDQLRGLTTQTPYKFILHIGDIKSSWTDCDQEAYSDIAEIFSHPSNRIHYNRRDVFFLIGDNEWSDCDSINTALTLWMNSFGNGQKTNGRNTGPNPNGFGTLSDPNVARTLVYDDRGENSNSPFYPSSASNFSFFHKMVLFVGINQVGGQDALPNNYQWVKKQMARYGDRMKTVVVFAHADMRGSRWDDFGRPFQRLLREEYPTVFCLYAHGDDHEFDIKRVDQDNANLVDLTCDSGELAEPILVSITRDSYGLRVDRRGGRYENEQCEPQNRDKTWGSEPF